ncbi:MAG: holo-ACP synthase [Armatimonadetes bacterium]|nr:holo-ACP synthase [Armatimonadota bacterium]
MIYSLGIDIIEIDRIREAMQRHPRMAHKLFTEIERAYCEGRGDPAAHFAARFAAKEAMAKAVGHWLRWQEVEVVNEPTGRPTISLRGEAAARARVTEGAHVIVSLSHSRDYAVGCVALVGPQEMPWFDEKLPPGSARV